MGDTEYIRDTELDSLYLELGKAYYEGAFEDPLPQLLPLFDKISEALEKYQQIDPAPELPPAETPVCPVCGAPVEEGIKFCAECGTQLERVATAPAPAAPAEKRCPVCGCVVGEDAKFCAECGTQL